MIKAKLSNGDLILGIDKHNLKKLKRNQPIKVKGLEVGPVEGDIFIVYGDTLSDVFDSLESMGLGVTKETKINEGKL